MAQAQFGTIRTQLLNMAAQVEVSVRRIRVSMSSLFPRQALFAHRRSRLRAAEAARIAAALSGVIQAGKPAPFGGVGMAPRVSIRRANHQFSHPLASFAATIMNRTSSGGDREQAEAGGTHGNAAREHPLTVPEDGIRHSEAEQVREDGHRSGCPALHGEQDEQTNLALPTPVL